jgi:type II secretory pathway component PulF
MPFYKWQGITINAVCCSGVLYAHSIDDLSEKLKQKNIALLRGRSIVNFSLKKIRLADKLLVTQQLAVLVNAGIPIGRALELSAHGYKNYKLAGMLYQAAHKIQSGIAVHEAMSEYAIFDPLLVQLVKSRELVGNYSHALDHAERHLSDKYTLSRSLWSSAYMPLITGILFIGISVFALIVVIPQFEQVYRSLDGQLPESTRRILIASRLLHESDLYSICLVAALFFALVLYRLRSVGKKFISLLAWHSPLSSRLLEYYHCWLFFNSLAYHVKAGTPLVVALQSSIDLSGYVARKKQLSQVTDQVASGRSLAHALVDQGTWPAEVIGMIEIGYESSSLAQMMCAVSSYYHHKCQKYTEKILLCFQPLLLIVLGFLIGYFVYVLYIPLFSIGLAL